MTRYFRVHSRTGISTYPSLRFTRVTRGSGMYFGFCIACTWVQLSYQAETKQLQAELQKLQALCRCSCKQRSGGSEYACLGCACFHRLMRWRRDSQLKTHSADILSLHFCRRLSLVQASDLSECFSYVCSPHSIGVQLARRCHPKTTT